MSTEQPIQPSPQNDPEMHWILAAIARKWPAVKGFIIHIACVAIGAIGIIFLYDKFVIPGLKEQMAGIKEQIAAKDATIQNLVARLDALNGTASPTESSIKATKEEADILSKQLFDFASKWDLGKRPYFQLDYENRFSTRVNSMRNSLDHLGQDSTNLDRMLGYTEFDGMRYGDLDSNYVSTIATEIKTLAGNLK